MILLQFTSGNKSKQPIDNNDENNDETNDETNVLNESEDDSSFCKFLFLILTQTLKLFKTLIYFLTIKIFKGTSQIF